MKREDYIKGITNYLGQVDSTIKIRNAIDLYDLNIIAESFFCELLNQVYGYCLLNKNTIVKHAPAIDLEDSINGVFVQESSLIFGVNCLRHNAMRSSLKREREQSQGSAREAGCGLCSRPQGGRNK